MKPQTRLLKTSLMLAAGLLLATGLAQGANDDRHDRHDQNNDRNDKGRNEQGRNDREQNNERRDHDDRNDDRHDRNDDRDNRQNRNDRAYLSYRFQEQNRVSVNNYYEQEYRRGRCPPGLSRKHNNCISPGHAKNWQLGQRLPREVVYYDLPPALIVEIGAPPRGSRYVRVGSDILLIALGTGLIIDAIDDLNRR